MRALVAAVLSVGCSFSGPGESGGASDAAPADTATADGPGGCETFSPSKAELDNLPVPDARPQLTQSGVYTYDTGTNVLADPGGTPIAHDTALVGDVRVLLVRAMLLGADATLEVTGDRPLYLVATERLDLVGTLDVSSDLDRPGPGAATAVCSDPAEPGGQDPAGAGGGGGGGFHGVGGDGSAGDGDDVAGATAGGSGGGAEAIPTAIRAGCPGGSGGAGGASPGGAGGLGGGGVEIAACELRVVGVIDAGGGAGGGGSVGTAVGISGGGGGGSGGYIGLEARALIVGSSTALAANGGGGGEGADADQGGSAGDPGIADAGPADGGSGGADQGADGAGGSSDSALAGQSATQLLDGGGGGGGGGAGYILIEAAEVSGTASLVSPPSMSMP